MKSKRTGIQLLRDAADFLAPRRRPMTQAGASKVIDDLRRLRELSEEIRAYLDEVDGVAKR